MTKAAAIYQFWNSFGLTAYEENSVPTDATFPYITYQDRKSTRLNSSHTS